MDPVVPVAPRQFFDRLDSTNAEALRRFEAGELGPLWIVAHAQSHGRGRRGRVWSMARGDLAATLMTTTGRAPADAARVSFVAALAVADLASHYAPEDSVALKWPNDLLVARMKAGGVLVESGAAAAGRLWLAVGVGVNIISAPLAVTGASTCLADHLRADIARPPTVEEAAEGLARTFAHWSWVWDSHGFEAIARAWTERAAHLGARCTARLPNETIEGVAEGLESDGALRLRLDDGAVRRITAGDVFPIGGLSSGVV